MIISCPKCSRSFQVGDSLFKDKPQGRKVRCSACKEEWVAAPPQLSTPEEPPMAVPFEVPLQDMPPVMDPFVREKPVRSRVPKTPSSGGGLAWLLFGMTAVAATLFFAVLMRHHLVVKWPGLSSYYRAVGITVVVAPPTFTLRKLTWGVRKEKGKHYLRVRGEVSYKSEREVSQRVPLLRIVGYGPNTCSAQGWVSSLTNGTDAFLEKGLCVGQQWIFKVTDETAIPGEVIPFTTEKEYDAKTFDPKSVAVEFVDS